MKKVRVQFDLPDHKVKELDDLMSVAGIATRRELLNNALALIEWAAKQRQAGYEIGAYHRKDKDLHILQMPALSNIEPNLNSNKIDIDDKACASESTDVALLN